MDFSYEQTLWRQMADQARTVAGRQRDVELRREMFQIAERYDALAKRAEVAAVYRRSRQDDAPTK